MLKTPLPLETRIAESADFELLVNYKDFVASTTNDATFLASIPVKAKMSVEIKRLILDTPFANGGDNTNNSTTVIGGDSGSTNRLLTSTELNLNGSYVSLKNGTGTIYPYTSTTTVDLIFTPKSGTPLSALTQGQVRVLYRIADERAVVPTA